MTRLTLDFANDFTDDQLAALKVEARRRKQKLLTWARNTLLDVAAAQAELTRIDKQLGSTVRKQ